MSEFPVFVGIDVSKAQLDLAVRPPGTRRSVSHDEAGVATVVEQLRQMRKLLTMLNAMLKHRTPWREICAQGT
jgi:hypothetical protein